RRRQIIESSAKKYPAGEAAGYETGYVSSGFSRRGSVVGVDSFLRLEDFGVLLALHGQDACQTLLEAGQGVIDDGVASRIVDLELDHGCATGRHQGGLHVGQRRTGQRSLIVDTVEDFADDVETRDQVGAADTEEDAHGF